MHPCGGNGGPEQAATYNPTAMLMSRAFTAALLSLLVLLGVSLGNPAARLSELAPLSYARDQSTPLRHAVLAASGRTAMAALRPVAKKAGAKGPDKALSVAGVAFMALDTPGDAPTSGLGSRRPEPAPHGYLARAPPTLV